MRPGNRTEIGATRGDDGVDVIAFENIPDGNRGNPDFISNAVGERHLEHASVHRLFVFADLTRRTIDNVRSRSAKKSRYFRGILWRQPSRYPIVSRDPHAHRLFGGPNFAHGLEYCDGILATIFERAAVVVGADICKRRDKARQQVTMRTVKFEPVETCHRASLRCRHKVGQYAIEVFLRGFAWSLR